MDVQVITAAAAGQNPAPAVPGQAPAAPATLPGEPDAATSHRDTALSPVLAKLFSQSGQPQPVSVNVSYRFEHQPNMVVMVFTDPQTGLEISQVPAEVVVQLAKFFDKQSGVTLDQNA